MQYSGKPRILILGGNFAGLTTARFIREQCGKDVNITVIDRKPYLLFVPNIPIEVFANRNPQNALHMPIEHVLFDDGIDFIQAEVKAIDVETSQVEYVSVERPGSSLEHIEYDYLVVALGARLAYDKIEGFGEYGSTLSDTYYGNRLRRYLHEGGYKGGPIVIGSSRFHQGTKGKPDWLPNALAACEGPPLEIGLSLGAWLEDHKLGGPNKITLFTPAPVIAEDAGEEIVAKFLEMAGNMGYNYVNKTEDIKRLTADGIEFTNGKSLEAEIKIVLPDWQPHSFMKDLPIVDEEGFVITDLTMRNPDYPRIFAAGDAAALTVPKLGTLGDMQARIVALQIAKDLGKVSAEKADEPFRPTVICMGDMGRDKGFYIHSDVWYGGKTSIMKMGHMIFALKLAFKEMYYRTGGKPSRWGLPLTELLIEHLT
ncbi:FAD-dependent oxidoreductase [Desulfosporosinus sp. PR]|uniref:NAD(P)/FAD-dependent oxidoreductase n=1 Tax=Candidatus Desulfosporosinus nitrosoreducens TaxID=3401928 RepID=UPI0027FB56C0|nr:FAD-dependent oxidoreductase [Desulfosporosinus sp. PR]MDQ7092315.1 FAD-dependent oxidoreductase [Desulfosporosinus sp. PR]